MCQMQYYTYYLINANESNNRMMRMMLIICDVISFVILRYGIQRCFIIRMPLQDHFCFLAAKLYENCHISTWHILYLLWKRIIIIQLVVLCGATRSFYVWNDDMDTAGLEYHIDTIIEFNNNKENLCQGQNGLGGLHYIRHIIHQASVLIPQKNCEFSPSKDMSSRQLALKSILTFKQVRTWSLLGWTPACCYGHLQHHLILHSSTFLCSPSILSLSFSEIVIMLWLALTSTKEIPVLKGLRENCLE